jgi:hypothetical protein
MANRPRHPDQDIERAIQYAEIHGWRVVISGGHAWGRLFCPANVRGACIVSVWSTPRNAVKHARQIRKRVDRCPHDIESIEEEN